MKARIINTSHIEGVLYQHDLVLKVTGDNSTKPGTEYISGNIEIATDDARLNVVPVHFTYVTATTAQGKENATFKVLKDIIDGNLKSAMGHGADVATKLRVDSAIGLNEFYSDRNGTAELVSVKRNEGGFVHVVNDALASPNLRNRFDVDMIITGVSLIEADPENNRPEKAIVKGAIFDFRKALLPTEFSAVHPDAISYFVGLDASATNPVFTRIKGQQIAETITREIREKSAFGADSVREVRNTRKDFVIDWAAEEPYVWDQEDTMTAAELTKAMQDRQTYLASVKSRYDEYNANKKAAPVTGGFNF